MNIINIDFLEKYNIDINEYKNILFLDQKTNDMYIYEINKDNNKNLIVNDIYNINSFALYYNEKFIRYEIKKKDGIYHIDIYQLMLDKINKDFHFYEELFFNGEINNKVFTWNLYSKTSEGLLPIITFMNIFKELNINNVNTFLKELIDKNTISDLLRFKTYNNYHDFSIFINLLNIISHIIKTNDNFNDWLDFPSFLILSDTNKNTFNKFKSKYNLDTLDIMILNFIFLEYKIQNIDDFFKKYINLSVNTKDKLKKDLVNGEILIGQIKDILLLDKKERDYILKIYFKHNKLIMNELYFKDLNNVYNKGETYFIIKNLKILEDIIEDYAIRHEIDLKVKKLALAYLLIDPILSLHIITFEDFDKAIESLDKLKLSINRIENRDQLNSIESNIINNFFIIVMSKEFFLIEEVMKNINDAYKSLDDNISLYEWYKIFLNDILFNHINYNVYYNDDISISNENILYRSFYMYIFQSSIKLKKIILYYFKDKTVRYQELLVMLYDLYITVHTIQTNKFLNLNNEIQEFIINNKLSLNYEILFKYYNKDDLYIDDNKLYLKINKDVIEF